MLVAECLHGAFYVLLDDGGGWVKGEDGFPVFFRCVNYILFVCNFLVINYEMGGGGVDSLGMPWS